MLNRSCKKIRHENMQQQIESDDIETTLDADIDDKRLEKVENFKYLDYQERILYSAIKGQNWERKGAIYDKMDFTVKQTGLGAKYW